MSRLRYLAACALVIGPGTAVAQSSGRPSAATATSTPSMGDFAFVISGGVSLGVYQAGFLYLTTEAMKRGLSMRLPLVTGASAGSANALITALNSCLPPNPEPSADLGWQTWMPVGYRELFIEERVTQLSAFSRSSLGDAMAKIYARWKHGLPEDCDFVLGVTTTRVRALPIEVQPDFSVPRQDEKFRFRIRGRGYGRAPRIENYIEPHKHVAQVIIPFEDDDDDVPASRRNFGRLRDVLFASGAFPAAFGPQTVVSCLNKPKSGRVTCQGRPRADLYVDGGVFDNNPLRLANGIAQDGLRRTPDGRGRWRDLTERYDPQPRQDELTFVYLDPTTTAYPGFQTDLPMPTHPTLLNFAQTLTGEWITSARAKELYEVTQERADLGARMRLTQSHYPMASNHIYAFLGFFEREFRHFDFHLGMYDAYVALDRPLHALPVNLGEGVQVDAIPESWRPFACMLGAFEADRADLRAACDLLAVDSFKILTQVSLDRMHDHCRRFLPDRLGRFRRHVRCFEASTGVPPIRVLPVPEDVDLTRGDDEERFDYFMRLLAEYRFHFKDLGLTPDEAEYGKVKVRRKLLKMVKYLANAQGNIEERLLLLTAGRSLVNTIEYEPPREWWYAAVGSVLEVGASFLPFDWLESWARVHAAFQVKGISSIITGDDDKLGFLLAVGPEFEPLFITTAYLQPMIGVRAAYQLTSRDTFASRICTEQRALGDQRLCSQFLLQGYLAVAVLERIRVQVTGEYYPIGRDFDNRQFDLQLSFGVHFF